MSIAGKGDITYAINQAINQHMRDNVDDMLPATVVSYNAATNRAVVKPLSVMVDSAGRQIEREPIGDIPVYRYGGGGFVVTLPVQPGDFGWLKASDRDITHNLTTTGTQARPQTGRTHSFSDGMFYPDTAANVPGASGSEMSMRSISGGSKLTVGSGDIGIDSSNIGLTSSTMTATIPTTTWDGDITMPPGRSISSGGSSFGSSGISLGGGASAGGTTISPGGIQIGGTGAGNSVIVASDLGPVSDAATEAAPPGVISYTAASSAPTGWLKANGAAVSRTTYAKLFAAIGTDYGPGDGSTTFNVPDLRGYHIRSLDDGRGVDSGRVRGSTQADQNKSHNHGGATSWQSADHTHSGTTYNESADHTHGVPYGPSTVGSGGGGFVRSTSLSPLGYISSTGISADHNHSFVTNGMSNSHAHTISAEGGTETRVKNVALLAIIKY